MARRKRSQQQKGQSQGRPHNARAVKKAKEEKARKERSLRQQRRAAKAAAQSWTVYLSGLVQAITMFFPGRFFSQWAVTKGVMWTPQRVFWLAILMVLSADASLQARFQEARDVLKSMFPKWSLGKTYEGWFEAQLKWIEPLRPALAKRMRKTIEAEAMSRPCWLREGWCVFAVDGSRVECPRTLANEKGLGCAGRDKTCPQLFLTSLLHVGTGLMWDFRIGPGTASERRHLEEMLEDLPKNALVVADAGFTGFELLRRLLDAKKNFLIRVGGNVTLLRGLTEAGCEVERRGDVVHLWPQANRNELPICLRLIEDRDGEKKRTMVTNVLDHAALSDQSAATLYEMRWGVEVYFRSLKQTLGKRTMRSRTPEAAHGELTWAVFGLWLLQAMTIVAKLKAGEDPLRWSAAQARDRVRTSLRRALAGKRDDKLLNDLASLKIDDYERSGSKKARNWPHKKREKPPAPAKLRLATDREKETLQRLVTKLGDV